ncbi:Na+/H+ antiporter subunit D [Rubinisphaera brasiliensis]|uniref:Multisubunit sodium/proton antiporter, MrpD subunit n=1 Tax=Rubinisphaera brasiliensis (strain ATCC 49424 / DSM 5305 / JCM 21570 / IAM 15109 / NBRC 103401 / IFAM 1448) TaxID=756272 RepID=F0SH94_RUBBR|nr:multisubunit sodium/proton antiporter, MrpD subunit [Rubinisphaera brasiliensis DSM 5305]
MSSEVAVIFPIALPLATMVISLLTWKSVAAQKWTGMVGSTLLFASAAVLMWLVQRDGILVMQVGDWPAPFGITFVADRLSSIMVLLAGLVMFAVSIYSLATIDERRIRFGFFPLVQLLVMGVCGAFLTGDLFNLYVWFEVMLIASFVLLTLGGEQKQLEGALKYVTLNLMSSAAFLAAIGVIYAATGTLNMADLAIKLRSFPDEGIVTVLAMLFLIAFGTKAAVFPLFFWLPASYHTPPVAVSAVFAGLLTKVGVYSLIRAFTLLFVSDLEFTHNLLLIVAGLTMVTGVLGAMAQSEIRRILSFHIVSQIGYMLMGLALFTPLALAGSVFYIIHHIVVKTNLFLIGGIAERRFGSGQLAEIGGMYQSMPLLAILFFLSAMSLAGIPPLSGFFAKLTLIRGGLEAERYVIVVAALAVSLLTLFSMTKIWAEAFWKPNPHEKTAGIPKYDDSRFGQLGVFAPVVLLLAVTMSIGVLAGPVMTLATATAEELLDPDAYITAVMPDVLLEEHETELYGPDISEASDSSEAFRIASQFAERQSIRERP